MPRLLTIVLAFALAIAAGVTWQQLHLPARATNAATAPPPMPVPVASAIVRDVPETAEFTGFLAAPDSVDLRPRVGGLIESVHVPEGGRVEKGQVLFRLDQRPYRVALARAEAALAESRERHALAERQHARTQILAARGHAASAQLDQSTAEREALAGQVAAAEAAVAAARLDLEFTEVRAPLSGRVGRALVTRGNLVAAGQGPLTHLVTTDPIHVFFDVDEHSYRRLLASVGEAAGAALDVDVGLLGDTGFPHRGRLDFLALEADRATGTARLRATVPNPDGTLAPGLFARVRVVVSPPRPTVLVTEDAVGSAQGGRYVLIAGADGVAAFRLVKIGPVLADGLRVIKEGLIAGEQVIARGMVRPGTRIAPHPVAPAALATQEPQS